MLTFRTKTFVGIPLKNGCPAFRTRLLNIVGWYYRLANRQTSGESASLPQYLGCNTVFDMRLRVTFLRRKAVSLQSNMSLLHCICLMGFEWVDLVLDWLGIRMLSYGTAILLLIIL